MKLLIHHHAVVYKNQEGIYLQSFIGNWINSLAPHFEEIGLLLHSSEKKKPNFDSYIKASNVVLHDLGPEGKTWDHIQRISRIRRVCKRVSSDYDVLLIRGITPRQLTIWSSAHTKLKAFLLVGSLKDSKPKFYFSKWYSYLMYFIRKNELLKISGKSLCMANSLHVAEEFQDFTGKRVFFAPTNSISIQDIQEFVYPKNNNAPRILFCGRVTRDKGIFELVEGVKELKKTYPGISLDIVGTASSGIHKKLESYITANNIGDQINWLGFVPFGKDLFKIFKSADYCVLPTYHEGFPKTIWEAGICSTPMITTKVGGIFGMVDETQVSFIESHSAASIVKKIIELQNNFDLKVEIAQHLYQLAGKYTAENNALKLKEILIQNS